MAGLLFIHPSSDFHFEIFRRGFTNRKKFYFLDLGRADSVLKGTTSSSDMMHCRAQALCSLFSTGKISVLNHKGKDFGIRQSHYWSLKAFLAMYHNSAGIMA